MSIIIQAGHRSSYSKVLMEKMYERGLNRPLNSFTHQLTCQQVTETIDKILLKGTDSISNNRLVDNVMVDFLLGNLDSGNWGWEAEKNLYAIDAWNLIEPNLCIVLVFEHPKYIFKGIDLHSLTEELLGEMFAEWVEYHYKLLEIAESYKNQTILVEGKSVLSNIVHLNKQINSIGHSLEFKSGWQIPESLYTNYDTSYKQDLTLDLIVEKILRHYPEAIKIFNILVGKAIIKDSSLIYKSKRSTLNELVEILNCHGSKVNSSFYVEKGLIDEDKSIDYQKFVQENKELKLNYKKATEEKLNIKTMLEKNTLETKSILDKKEVFIKSLENKNISLIDSIKKLELERKNYLDLKDNLNIISRKNEELRKENETILKQLHSTQEELEKKYINKEELNINNKQLGVKKKQFNSPVDIIKQDLPYRLGSKIVKAKDIKSVSLLPISLFNEYQEFKKSGKIISSELSTLCDSKDIEEIEKVKKHLSYQLGTSLLEGASSPKKMLSLPFTLGKKIIVFKG